MTVLSVSLGSRSNPIHSAGMTCALVIFVGMMISLIPANPARFPPWEEYTDITPGSEKLKLAMNLPVSENAVLIFISH